MPGSNLGFSNFRKFDTGTERHRESTPTFPCEPPAPCPSCFHSPCLPQRAVSCPFLGRGVHTAMGEAALRMRGGRETPHAGRQAVEVGLGYLGRELQGLQRPQWCLVPLQRAETKGGIEWAPPGSFCLGLKWDTGENLASSHTSFQQRHLLKVNVPKCIPSLPFFNQDLATYQSTIHPPLCQ